MKAPPSEATLKAKVCDPGYTPSVRDAAALFGLLADEDDTVVRNVERALVRVGGDMVARATRYADAADAPLRAGIARLLGRVAGEADARTWLVLRLTDHDGHVRRAAARALGKLPRTVGHGLASPEVEGVEVALLEALARATEGAEQRAIAASLGKVGSVRAIEQLRAISTKDPELVRIVGRATMMLTRDASRADAGAIDGERIADTPLAVVLHCRKGLEDLVVAEIAEKIPSVVTLGAQSGKVGAVHGELRGPMRALFAVRTMTTFAFMLTHERVSVPTDVPRILVEALVSERARRILETYSLGPVRYRIAWTRGGHRRADVWQCAEAIAKQRPAWINDPTESTWEVIAHEHGNEVTIELEPRALVDPRFAYRERDVPAASHPTIAAALVRSAGIRADDVVWDPFVGSGTELVERALAGPYRALYGSDIAAHALDAARANLAARAIRAELARADATTYAPRGVTLILTNPPMGRRVARGPELGELLDRFVDHVAEVLVPRGRFVWMSALPSRTAARAARAGLTLEGTRDVDMGGFSAQMQRFVRP